MLTKSISMQMDAKKKYYKIVGMLLAMQMWFYECCSDVDSKIALRVDDVVPRILNWRTTGYHPTFAYLMNGIFNDTGNMKYAVAFRYIFGDVIPAVVSAVIFSQICCIQLHTNASRLLIVYKDISPSDIELVVVQIPHVGVDVEKRPFPARSDKSGEDSDDFSPTPELQYKKKHVAGVGPSLSPPHKKCKEHEMHPNETEYQPKIPPICVVGEFKSLRTLINDNFKKLSDHLQQNQQTESLHQIKEPIGIRDDGIDTDVGDNVEKQVLNDQCLESRGEGKTTSEVSSNIPSTGQEGVSTEFYVSQFELDDKFLPSQIPETRIVIHNSAKKAESTPIPSHRNQRLSRWYSSPYESNFDSAVKLTPIFEKRHPFEDDSITRSYPMLIIQEYNKWIRDGLLARHDQRSNLEDHYKKNKSTLHIPLDFGVDQVNSKNWFYLLSFDGKLWDDNHIDVIFHYLRKKGKYNQTSNFKYTTVDCIFKTRIAEIFDMYADTDSNANVAKEEDVVCEYIRGYRLHANVPWHIVDNVMIPVNLKDKLHWVLVVVSFKERCIKVYDSYRSAGHDAYVVSEIDKLTKRVPLYLSISGFYRDSQGIDWSTYSTYTNKSHNDPFEVFFHFRSASTESWDCGVHVAAYAEFLSTLGKIPQITFDSTLLRQRYGALLWDYAM
ncbi:uncharacterized protein [Nicotiana sylvestris]|uniref:uncharacterized protein n=1 Tax=Nicotiana sylvestris TaxID=4096 RepID=UPI00388C5EC4